MGQVSSGKRGALYGTRLVPFQEPRVSLRKGAMSVPGVTVGMPLFSPQALLFPGTLDVQLHFGVSRYLFAVTRSCPAAVYPLLFAVGKTAC